LKFASFSEIITKIENSDLPGEAAHRIMSPPFRKQLAKQMAEKSKFAKKAAVLAMFYPDELHDTRLALILRNSYPGVHSDQVGFPGGKIELTDTSYKAAALRETEEEIGVNSKLIKVVRAMSPLYIPPSNYIVYPYLGLVNQLPNFVKEISEVQEIIEVKLSDFLNPCSVLNTKVPTSYNVEVEVPAFLLEGYVVWGATAMMLSEIKEVLNQIL
jgi:8-oxo-dGTP pyrophosphatase MutT (NUDIX family)